MEQKREFELRELGLPRANSNGLFLFAAIILAVCAVMMYSCVNRRHGQGDGFDSPPQALTGNEWFVGKASGLELPKPTPLPAQPTPTPIPRTPQKAAKAAEPKHRLGGKIIPDKAAPTQLASNERGQQPRNGAIVDEFLDDEPIAFGTPPPAYRSRLSAHSNFRPEYYLERDVEMPVSDFEVKAGTSLPAQLDIALNSDLGGPAVAHITRTIYDSVSGQFALIPPGTKLYGTVDPNVTFGQSRLNVVWERLIFPNGASLVVDNMRASDRAGQTGLHDTVDNHFDRLYGSAILLSAISAGIQLSQPQQSATWGQAPSVGQTLGAALGQNLGQVSTDFFRRQMNVKPTIIIPTGEHFTVIVNKDMVLPGPFGAWE